MAEDLTAETFMAAVASAGASRAPQVSVAWLIGIARHKLVDHWRRAERERAQAGAAAEQEQAADRGSVGRRGSTLRPHTPRWPASQSPNGPR